MVVMTETEQGAMVANNGFVWIEFPDGSERVLGASASDRAWARYDAGEDLSSLVNGTRRGGVRPPR